MAFSNSTARPIRENGDYHVGRAAIGLGTGEVGRGPGILMINAWAQDLNLTDSNARPCTHILYLLRRRTQNLLAC
jgi:hypothetical protein